MKPSTDLFELIKSLTKSEKRYFKRYTTLYSNTKDNNYLKLFEAIDKQDTYDEVKIKNQFKNERFVKQLNVIKNYLYNSILKSNSILIGKNSIKYSLKEAVVENQFLFNKCLYRQSWKLIQAKKKLAYKHELYLLIVELIGNEKLLLSYLNIPGKEEKLEKIIEEEMYVLNEIVTIRKLINYQREVMLSVSALRSPVEDINVNSHLMDLLKKIDSVKISQSSAYISQSVYYHAKSAVYIAQCEYGQALECCLNLHKLLKNYETMNTNTPHNIYGVLHNLVYIYLHLNAHSEASIYFSELKRYFNKLKIQSDNNLFFDLKCSYIYIQILLNNRLLNYSDSLSIIEDFQKSSSAFLNILKSNEYVFVNTQIMLTYSLTNQWEKALMLNNDLMKNFDTYRNVSLEMLHMKLQHLIYHYELKNYDYIEYYIPKLKKQLAEKKDGSRCIGDIVNCIQKSLMNDDRSYIADLFRKLEFDLTKYKKIKIIYHYLTEFYIFEWVKVKISANNY